jgi:hypothetical protein
MFLDLHASPNNKGHMLMTKLINCGLTAKPNYQASQASFA